MLQDDNILTPLFIKLPGVKGKKLNVQVGLIDVYPTIASFLKLEDKINSSLDGESLLPLMRGDAAAKVFFSERFLRVDCRFIGQSNRQTALRRTGEKFIFHHDTKNIEFFDLLLDPEEDHDQSSKPVNKEKIEIVFFIFIIKT